MAKLSLIKRLLDKARQAKLDESRIKTNPDGSISYPEEYINPLSDIGAGDVRREVAIHNDEIMGTDTKGEFNDTDLYHSIENLDDGGEITEFIPSVRGKLGKGVYTSPRPEYSQRYIDAENEGARVIPTRVKGNLAEMDEFSKASDEARIELQAELDESGQESILMSDWKDRTQQILKNKGFTGKQIQDESVVFDPKNIRSKNAAFDPQFKDSSNLLGQSTAKNLAGVAGLTSAGLAAPLAYNAVKDPLSESYNQTMDNIANRDRSELEPHSELAQRSYDRQMAIKDKFFSKRALRQAAKNVVGTGEAALTLGSGLANESAAGLAAMYGGATGQDPNAILNHFNENASLYLPQTDEGMAQLEGLQQLIQDNTDYWSPRGGAKAVENFKRSQDWLNTQGSKISPEVGAGLATGLGLLPELL